MVILHIACGLTIQESLGRKGSVVKKSIKKSRIVVLARANMHRPQPCHAPEPLLCATSG